MSGPDSLPESVRNRLLRRADWRFLLPEPCPTRTVCFAGGQLARAVAAISSRMVEVGSREFGDCDLSVAINPDARTLRDAWAALHPGGACYTEWPRPLPGGTRAIRRRLAAAGFAEVTCYFVWPWPARAPAQFWLPLDSPEALGHFLASRPAGRGWHERAGRRARQVAWSLAVRSGVPLPICAVARRPGVSRAAPDGRDAHPPEATTAAPGGWPRGEDLEDFLGRNWESWGFPAAAARPARLLLTGGRRSINKAVLLLFAAGEPSPRLAVKMPRVPEAIPGLIAESTTLAAVHEGFPGSPPGIPRPLFCERRDGLVLLGETALEGRPLLEVLRDSTHRDLALKGTAWLAALAGSPPPAPRATWWPRLVEPAVAAFREGFGRVVDPGLLRESDAIVASMGDLPLVAEQRDFSPWNVLLADDGQLAVLDWESAEPRGLPALDLTYFLAYLTFLLLRDQSTERCRAEYRALLYPTTARGAVFRECFAIYAAGTGLAREALPPLRLLTWMIHSRSEYRQFAADAGGPPAPSALRRGLFVGLWEEEVRHGAGRSRGPSIRVGGGRG